MRSKTDDVGISDEAPSRLHLWKRDRPAYALARGRTRAFLRRLELKQRAAGNPWPPVGNEDRIRLASRDRELYVRRKGRRSNRWCPTMWTVTPVRDIAVHPARIALRCCRDRVGLIVSVPRACTSGLIRTFLRRVKVAEAWYTEKPIRRLLGPRPPRPPRPQTTGPSAPSTPLRRLF